MPNITDDKCHDYRLELSNKLDKQLPRWVGVLAIVALTSAVGAAFMYSVSAKDLAVAADNKVDLMAKDIEYIRQSVDEIKADMKRGKE